MNWMPSNTVLGELKMLDTFVEYDGPRVFSCISLTDQIYLAIWANEGSDGDSWIYLPISQARISMVKSGGIALRSAIESPEGIVFEAFLPHNTEEDDVVVPVVASRISDSWLPEPGFCLDLDTHTLPVAELESIIETKARQESRTRLRMRVKLPKFARSEAPARVIGGLLIYTQSMYDNIGYAIRESSPSPKGKIPSEITGQTAISMVGAAASSFMLELASNELDDLLGNSLFVQTTDKFLDLLDLDLEYPQLAEKLADLKPRAAKSFRTLVEKFAETGGDVTIAAASSSIAYAKRELSAEHLQEFSKTLKRLVPEEQIVEVRRRMRLFKIDTARRTFGFRDESVSPAEDYEGAIDDMAWPQASHATIQDNYDVLILGTTVIDETVGERKTTYRLVQVSHVSGEVR